MPLDGGRLTRTSDEGGENTATYYVETLNGSESGAICVDNRWFIVHHYDKTKGTSGNTVGPEDRYAITGFEPISNLGTQVGQKYKNAKFYYSRSSYDIVYVNTGAKDNDKHTVSYKFEASITDAGNYEPTTPPAGKEGYVFAGWYADPAGEQAYDFTGKTGNVKKCAVGKYPKSEKHGNTAQFSEVERSGTQENCGGIGSGCRLRLRPLPVLRRRQSQRVARIDPNAVVVDKNIAENDRFDLFSRQLVRRNLIDLLFLERGEKALHPCVVEAMSGAAEALYHAAARQLGTKG